MLLLTWDKSGNSSEISTWELFLTFSSQKNRKSSEGVQGEAGKAGNFPRSNAGPWLSCSRRVWGRRLEQSFHQSHNSQQDLWISQEGGALGNIWNLGVQQSTALCPGNSEYSCFPQGQAAISAHSWEPAWRTSRRNELGAELQVWTGIYSLN